MGAKDIEHFCPLNDESRSFIGKIFELKSLSMRTYHKVLKVARTIADLEGSEDISISHLSEAVSYRGLEEHLYGAAETGFARAGVSVTNEKSFPKIAASSKKSFGSKAEHSRQGVYEIKDLSEKRCSL
jgi:magnesium chelatase family protein